MDDINTNKPNNEITEPIIEKEKFALIGQLLSGLLHNLNTPLMGSSGQLLLSDRKANKLVAGIKDKTISEEDLIKSLTEIINHNSIIRTYLFYMSDVIGAVKTYVKTSNSQNTDFFNIQELFEKVQLLTSFELKKSKIKSNFDIDSSLQSVNINGELNSLIQVLINLIDNAIHSYNGNRGSIDIKAYQELVNNKQIVKISVEDFGSGIKKDIQSKIFSQMVTTKGTKGTGIGLYLSNIIIRDKFNGTIEYESKHGKGTKMTLLLNPDIS